MSICQLPARPLFVRARMSPGHVGAHPPTLLVLPSSSGFLTPLPATPNRSSIYAVRGVVLATVALLMSSTEPSRVPLRLPDLALLRPPTLLQIHRILNALLHAQALEDTTFVFTFQPPTARPPPPHALRLSTSLAPVLSIASRTLPPRPLGPSSATEANCITISTESSWDARSVARALPT
ncbi:hypothetical protein GUJ93_ZPchr0010g8951 [Zizania palustris]|uniref:Uncharacterized protein n=1 Tax=Zizania palustris TaxID=103762 RepID=A0A8J5W7K7_ZIZPA|nr:hypothetical protein GUJ93_ZPchr0010g8951 [Zizania palustris]